MKVSWLHSGFSGEEWGGSELKVLKYNVDDGVLSYAKFEVRRIYFNQREIPTGLVALEMNQSTAGVPWIPIFGHKYSQVCMNL